MTTTERIFSLHTARLLLGAFFAVSVVLPIISMGTRIAQPGALAVFSTELFGTALINSIASSLLGTIVIVGLALMVALCLARTNIKHKEYWIVVLTLPMLIPSIAHGLGVVYLFGSNGLITKMLGGTWSIYGMPGIIMGSMLYAFPPALLMLWDALRYENGTPYQAANVMGVPRLAQLVHITLPYLIKPLICTVFATFTLIITDYGVPVTVGGKFQTLSLVMFQQVVGRLNLDSGIAIGAVLIIPAFAAFVVDVLTRSNANASYAIKAYEPSDNVARDIVARIFCGALAIALVLPICMFAFVGFVTKYPVNLTFTTANIERAFVFGVQAYLGNSLLIAGAVAVIGTAIAWMSAYLTARITGKFSKLLHLICILTMGIPGMVLGLAYMLAFKGSAVYGTLIILIFVNMIHFFASPYLMAYNSLNKANEKLEAVSLALGIPRGQMIVRVLIPQTRGTIFEMLSYFFVNCMVTISAVSFLASVADMPLSLLISDFDTQALVECAALVSLVIFVVNVLTKLLLSVAKHLLSKRSGIFGV